MRNSSLKRMLESAEKEEVNKKQSSTFFASLSNIPDLYNLPARLESDHISSIVSQPVVSEDITCPTDVLKAISVVESTHEMNAQQRAEYIDDPTNYLESETELNASLHSLQSVATDHALLEAFIDSKGISVICGCLLHANDDIVATALGVLLDITDEAVVSEIIDPEKLVSAIKESGVIAKVAIVMGRLAGTNSEYCGQALKFIANVQDIDDGLITRDDLNQFLRAAHSVLTHDSPEWLYNRSFSVEIMISELSRVEKEDLASLVEEELLDSLLVTLFRFRDNQPAEPLENELFNNVVDLLYVIESSEDVCKMIEALDGVELLTDLLVSSKERQPLLRVISRLVKGNSSRCAKFIDRQGLRIVGSLLQSGKPLVTEHCLTIAHELLVNSPPNHRNRVIGKFVESDFQKLSIVVNVFASLLPTCKAHPEKVADNDDFLRRSERGLVTLQQAALILLALFDTGIRSIQTQILEQFVANSVSLQDFLEIVFEYAQLLDTAGSTSDVEALRECLTRFQSTALAS